MKRMITRKQLEKIHLILILLILIFTALVSNRLFFRIDVTENKAYTISEASREILGQIDDTVEITYYISQQLLNYSPKAMQIIDFLKEYTSLSRGKINLRIVDPVKTREVPVAEEMGIQPQELELEANSETRIITVYTGIAIRHLKDYKSIPNVYDTATLEYELSSRIRLLVLDEEIRVGIIVGDDSRRLDEDYSLLNESLAQVFLIREIDSSEQISPYLDALVLLGSRNVTAAMAESIEKYMNGGGNLLLCMDGVYVDLNGNYAAHVEGTDNVRDLLDSYGVHIPGELVLDISSQQISIPGRWPIEYMHWVSIQKNNVNPEHPLTARFTGLDLFWPGHIAVDDSSPLNPEALITSTSSAWLMSKDFNTNPYKQELHTRYADKSRGSYTFAVAGTHPAHDGKILIISDCDFLTNMVQYSASTHNLLFFENALQWAADSEEMLSMKNRTVRDTRLNAITGRTAEKRLYRAAQLFNVGIVPLFILLFGAVHLLRRKTDNKVN